MHRFALFLITFCAFSCASAQTQDSLDAEVRKLAGAFQGKVWLYARNLDTGASYGLGENERVRTASTIKLPIMAAVFAKVEAGEAKWDERLPLRKEDKVSGSGVLREFSDGLGIPLRDVVHMMIVVSDNTATNMIIERFGADAVNEFCDKLGLKDTRALRKVRGDGTQLNAPSGWSKAGLLEENKRFGLGVSTSREMVVLLEKLERGEVVNAAASKEMIAILKRQQYKDGIGRRAAGFEVASKSGALDRLRSDVGIAYTKGGRIAMAITVDGMPKIDYSPDNAGNILIWDLAQALSRGLAKPH
jgi:beta-lactamase class A